MLISQACVTILPVSQSVFIGVILGMQILVFISTLYSMRVTAMKKLDMKKNCVRMCNVLVGSDVKK